MHRWLCVTPERPYKTSMMMTALHDGYKHQRISSTIVRGAGVPPNDRQPFVVWGQNWLALRIIPAAYAAGRPWWNIDNGYWQPAKGGRFGFYRLTYKSMSPVLLRSPNFKRARIQLQPWRSGGKHVLLCLPGADFGKAIGVGVDRWLINIEARVRAATDRKVIVRPKGCSIALSKQLQNCWAMVTHSSTVAVDAVLAGVPVFVAPTSPASPVGRTDLDLENPMMPDRQHWLASLACQHFTIDEMRSGVAAYWMQQIAEQVDGGGPD